MSVDVIRKAVQATEEGFLSVVSKQWPLKPQIAAVGSCCLLGIVCDGKLFVANLGDSRAVMGKLTSATGGIQAVQLSREHNASMESERRSLRFIHPDDPNIVILRHNVWRVKGIIQGNARKLVKAALQRAAKKTEVRYSDLMKIERAVRQHFHDDISVVVLFLDSNAISRAACSHLQTLRTLLKIDS
ncbi:hypothetical protein Droror1_Dr00021234 [Drosera rotundifolia]